jgi:hypothetical protein
MWKYLFAVMCVMHGLAHVAGPLGFWTSGAHSFAEKPWLFSKGITPQGVVGWVFGLLWVVAALGLVGAGLGLLFGRDWWPTLALVGAVISLVAIVPWARVVPPGAWAGVCFDLAILVALLLPWADRVVEAVS